MMIPSHHSQKRNKIKELAWNEAKESAEKNLRIEGVSFPTGKDLKQDLLI